MKFDFLEECGSHNKNVENVVSHTGGIGYSAGQNSGIFQGSFIA
jgi:hypothetical protein